MCGIACVLDIQNDPKMLRERVVSMANPLRHRGPDSFGKTTKAFLPKRP